MSGLSFRGFTYMLLIAFLIWSSNFECCIARRGKHWRHKSRTVSASLFKNKGKGYNGNGHKGHRGGGSNSKSKPKPPPPTHRSTPTPPSPKKAPPPHKSTPSSPPIPKPKVSPSSPPPKAYNGVHSTIFNVLDYGAKANNNTDDTKVKSLNFTMFQQMASM